MINHGLSTGALFLLVGIIYERRHTRMIAEYGGISKQMPVYATFFLIITMSSIGLPALNGFIGEFTILVGAFDAQLGGGRPSARSASCSARPTCCGCTSASSSGRSTTRRTRSSRTSTAARSPTCCRSSSSASGSASTPSRSSTCSSGRSNYVVARVDKDYAEQLRAAGTLPTLEAELRPAGGGAAPGGGK